MSKEGPKYLTFIENDLEMLPLRDIVVLVKGFPEEKLWSGRFTGILGMPDCPSGNRGPKDEVIFAFGKQGLAFLISMGFVPCPTCHPENQPRFWEEAEGPIETTYHLDNIYDFALLDFDASHVNWEMILPLIKKAPSRLYVSKDMTDEEVLELKERFRKMGFALPPTGYYDREAPGHFREHLIPQSSSNFRSGPIFQPVPRPNRTI